jgi:hypothetical protein
LFFYGNSSNCHDKGLKFFKVAHSFFRTAFFIIGEISPKSEIKNKNSKMFF